ncbi:hypothetical protein ONS95_009736 [Cadophora gregata]|uniref:uncharacterized protein n=1 Tax=Cadophora gregata TaxID=51156 RepID=UPI0026DD5B3F|nr:uncharacterized protein ONS95_009736 [Cadophora gregata]KAK0121442.1 hypothetical protein ONS95_009736 [Cadophora gregata]
MSSIAGENEIKVEIFHLFPHLIPELRIHIWALAIDDRVVKLPYPSSIIPGRWSPTLPPAVTRACHESRNHCSYQRWSDCPGPSYIWVNFDHDIIQIKSDQLGRPKTYPLNDIKHLRVDLVDSRGEEDDDWYHYNSQELYDFPKLQSVDILGPRDLCCYTQYIGDFSFGHCPKSNVRVITMKTGEWIDNKTAGAYQDYLDLEAELGFFTRVVNDRDYEDEEERLEDVRQLQIPLPRVDLSYL